VQYDYRYAVDDPLSGVINDRWEHRHGDYVKGAYSVLGPDGRVRTVDYEVDGPKGFHAVIRTQFPSESSGFKSRKSTCISVITYLNVIIFLICFVNLSRICDKQCWLVSMVTSAEDSR
jgi:hypothetical protein